MEEKYTGWLPDKMAERAEAKAAALKAEMLRLQELNLEEEFWWKIYSIKNNYIYNESSIRIIYPKRFGLVIIYNLFIWLEE